MRLHQTVIIAVLIGLFLSPNHLAGEEKGPLSRFDVEQLKKLQAGEPVCVFQEDSGKNENAAGLGQCSIIINAPIDQGFEILSNIENQAHYVPGKKMSTIVSRNENKLGVDNEYQFDGATIRYHSIFTINKENYRIEFEIDQSRPHDLAANSGFHQLEKMDEKTILLTHGATKFELGASSPKFIKEFLLGKSLPVMAINLKKYIESNGQWRQEQGNSGDGQQKNPFSSFSGQQLEKLKAGEPVCVYKEDSGKKENSSGNGQCSIIINASINKCFEILMKIDRQVYWVPNKKKSTIVSSNDNKHLIDNKYVFYGITVKYHSLFTIDQKNYRIEWEIDKSRPHDLLENSGFYQLEKIDEKTALLTYGATKIDVGVGLSNSVPEFIKKYLLGKSLPIMAINAKKYIESDEKWRQED